MTIYYGKKWTKCSSFVTGISANGQTIAPVVHFLHETTIKKNYYYNGAYRLFEKHNLFLFDYKYCLVTPSVLHFPFSCLRQVK